MTATQEVAPPPLSPRQEEALRFIGDFFARHETYPTLREISTGLNLRTNTPALYIDPLLKKGYLRKLAQPIDTTKRLARNLRLTKYGQQWLDEHREPVAPVQELLPL